MKLRNNAKKKDKFMNNFKIFTWNWWLEYIDYVNILKFCKYRYTKNGVYLKTFRKLVF